MELRDMAVNGGRFDFDDGGSYCGGWEEAKAQGYGIATGPENRGEYAGAWHHGFEVSGTYTWPTGYTYAGQWQNGIYHGYGVMTRHRYEYRGEWTNGTKGRYGLRQAYHTKASYLGTWASGFSDGYGTETYTDGGTYQGQWQRGYRHGYGIRTSAPFSIALKSHRSRSHTNGSLTSLRSDLNMDEPGPSKKDKKKDQNDDDEIRGGFVLRVRSEAPARRRRSLSERSLAVKRTILSNLRIKKQHSTGDIHQRVTSMGGSLKSSGSTMSCTSDEDADHHHALHPFTAPEERIDGAVIETYKGEWKNDKRSGFGVCERSDNVKYAGEWFNNRKHGYGITYFRDGTREEGRYKNNVLVQSTRKRGLMFVRTARLKERIEASVEQAKRAADFAEQRVEITHSRTATAMERAEMAVEAARRAHDDANTARICAVQFDPTFQQPGLEHMRQNRAGPSRHYLENHAHTNHVSFESNASAAHSSPHHRMQSGPSSSVSGVDPLLAHAAQPNFAPAGLYQQPQPSTSQLQTPQQQQQQSAHFQQPGSSQQTAAEVHPQTSVHVEQQSHQLQQQSPAHSQAAYQQALPQQQNVHHPQQQQSPHYADDQTSQIARVDAETARLLQAQAHQAAAHVAAQTAHLQPNSTHYAQQTSESNRSAQVGNSVGNRLHPTDGSSHDAAAPRMRQVRNNEGRSTMSLSDDHYDQYTMNSANPGGAQLRKNRPSLTRQTEVLADAVHLNRRSTLASSRDRQGTSRGCDSMFGWEQPGAAEGDRGSLPNLDELATHGIHLRREDAARLASQRRQEAQRMLEEEELLRANPLRYLYHPSLRNWLYNHQAVIALVTFNFVLLYVLFYLLTHYEDRNSQDRQHS